MKTIQYIYWYDSDAWLGYLEEFPNYWTQGTTLEDLVDHLKNLYHDLSNGLVPGIP